MKRSIQIGLGLLVSAVCLWFTLRGFNFASLSDQAASYSLGWCVPAAMFYVTAFALRSARWRWILIRIRPMNYWTVAPALIFGFMMNSVLPARGGELARAIAIAKKGGIPTSSALGTIVAERTLDLLGLTAIMLVAAKLLPWEKLPVVPIFSALAALVAAMILATIYLPRLPAGRTPLAKKILSFVAQIGAGFSVIRTPSKMVGLALVSIAIWMCDVGTMMILSRAAGLDLSIAQAAALQVGIAIGVTIPAAPGYVGTYEFFGKETLLLLGFSSVPALTFVIFLHFFQVTMIVLLGIPSILSLSLQRAAEQPS